MIVLVLVMVVTGILFAWLLVELGRIAVGEFRPRPRLSVPRALPSGIPVSGWMARFVRTWNGRDASAAAPSAAASEPAPSTSPGAAPASVEPWRAEEEVEERVYERLYGHHERLR